MTLPELAAELQKDYKEVAGRWKAFEPKFEKMRKRQMAYPWLWQTTVETRRKNKWDIGYYAFSKKDASVVWPQISISFRYQNSTWAACFIPGEERTLQLIFSSHFFERYIERFLKTSSKEIEYPIKELAKLLFIRNYHITPYRQDLEDRVRGFCEDGMFLGDWLSEDVGLVKTFLSRDELKPNQYVEYFDVFRTWIIGDMFMSHRRGSLTTEEYDKLPDAHFHWNVWREFLLSRGNPIWNKILSDWLAFKKKHPEDYARISRMLDAIADNR